MALLAFLPLATAPASAQTLSQLSDVLGAGKSAAGGALGGLGGGIPSVDQASTGNLAGVLEYCVKHKYLGGGDAKSVSSSLLGKATGSGDDSGYKAGSSGLLETGGGKTFGLGGSGGGIQSQVTDKVCDLVLEHAQSLL